MVSRPGHGLLGALWILNLVLLGLLVLPISDGDALLVALGLWSVPTGVLLLLSWRDRQHHHEDDDIPSSAHGGTGKH